MGTGTGGILTGHSGTLGGALAMNAGAFGGETWRHVIEVQPSTGRVASISRRRRVPGELPPGARATARGVVFGGALVSSTAPAGAAGEVRACSAAQGNQPIGEWSWRFGVHNPPGDHAARFDRDRGASRVIASAMPPVSTKQRPISSSTTATRAPVRSNN